MEQGQFKPKTNSKGHRWIIFLCAILLFGVSGCGEGTSPSSFLPKSKPHAGLKKKEEPPKVADEKQGEKKTEEEYSYNPSNKADPFKPFLQVTSGREGSRGMPLTPLQKYDISQLKLVAIISAPEGNVALVEDALGKGYILKKGTWVGKNDGKVIKISKDKVIIEEVYQDFLGQTKTNEILMDLHKNEEGGEL
jgi:type IV pilus assembly protein PilP